VSSWSKVPVLFFKDISTSEDKDTTLPLYIGTSRFITQYSSLIAAERNRQSDIKLALGRRPGTLINWNLKDFDGNVLLMCRALCVCLRRETSSSPERQSKFLP
jgi:hypothetical protein